MFFLNTNLLWVVIFTILATHNFVEGNFILFGLTVLIVLIDIIAINIEYKRGVQKNEK